MGERHVHGVVGQRVVQARGFQVCPTASCAIPFATLARGGRVVGQNLARVDKLFRFFLYCIGALFSKYL